MSLDAVPGSAEYRAELYEDFLKYVRKRYSGKAWFALPRDVAAYVQLYRHIGCWITTFISLSAA
jgi:hypothetical protein